MTPTNYITRTEQASTHTRLPLVLITNLCVAVFLLLAVPLIYKGQQGFVLHAATNNDYVEAAIGSGEMNFMHNALRTTEMARAMAYDDHVSTMAVMQLIIAFLALLFFCNSFYLFRLHRRSRNTTLVSRD